MNRGNQISYIPLSLLPEIMFHEIKMNVTVCSFDFCVHYFNRTY